MKEVNGRIVLITGGAGGIGKAMARHFKALGARVAVADIPSPKLNATARELNIKAYPMDVTKPASIQKCRKALLKDMGGIDVLVNNAGVVFGGPFGARSLKEHFLTYEVNTLGVVAVTHAFYADLCERPDAHIVFIASASGYIGLPDGSTYASSKWAAIGFGESIRLELKQEKKTHVNVTIVCPSYIDTGMFTGARAPLLTPLLQPEYVAERVVAAVQSNRAYVNLPWIVNLMQTLRGILPLGVFDLCMRLFGATSSMTQWTGHGKKRG